MQDEMFNDSISPSLSNATPHAKDRPLHKATGATGETKEELHAVGSDAIAAPRGWQIMVAPDHLCITRKSIRVGSLLFIVCLAGGICLEVRYGLSGSYGLSGTGWALVVFACSFGIAWLGDILLNERVVIEISRGRLRSTYRPIPWPNRSFKTSDISQLYCVDVYHSRKSGGYYTYNVMLMTKQGRRKKIASGFDNKQDALALEYMVENYLRIEDQSVAESFFERNQAVLSIVLPMVLVIVTAGVIFLTSYFVFKPNASVQPQIHTATDASRLTEEDLTKKQNEIAQQELLNKISGYLWVSRRVVGKIFTEEILLEFRNDLSGNIRINLTETVTQTVVDTQMKYEVGREQVRIMLPEESELAVWFKVRDFGESGITAKITPESTKGELAKRIGAHLNGVDRFRQQPSDQIPTK